jgi:hypothetical protein
MKSAVDWEEDDLLDLVQIRARESRNLEFKSCAALARNKTLEIAKDVSAFANAGGGTIVYGIIDNKETREAERLDEGCDLREISELWLEQVIDSNIQQRLEGVVIKAVNLTKSSPGKVAYVVLIPESNRAPHMVNHKYYKRQNFRVVEMEEDEIRERYRRDSFPGKEIVEAWRDDVINPLITSLSAENKSLESERWDWNRYYKKFSAFGKIGDTAEFSPNKEDFVERHPSVRELLGQHDLFVDALNLSGTELFDQVSKTLFIRDIFNATTSEEALEALLAENPNVFSGKTGAEVFRELFGSDRDEQERYNSLAEWTINGYSPANTNHWIAFWTAYRHRFHVLILYPPLSEFRLKVEAARSDLQELNSQFIAVLKQIRKELSERHRIPVEAPRSSSDSNYFGYPWTGAAYKL